MKIVLNNSKPICFFRLEVGNQQQLVDYFNRLSPESKNRFGPHPFTADVILQLLNDGNNYHLFAAKQQNDEQIIAYAILKRGWLDFEYQRLVSYGLSPLDGDFTIAPSVADEWQGKGVGSHFLQFIINQSVNELDAKRLILWGGVQSNNTKAVKLYQRFGFKTLGEFEHNDMNMDMILEL